MAEQANKQLLEYISKFKPVPIEPQCTEDSLYKQIVQNRDHLNDRQLKQFNVGEEFDDPIEAAEYLLEREYGETFLFKPENHEAIFIPSEFVSNQHFKKSSTPLLGFDIVGDIKRTCENLKDNNPDHWFTKELHNFLNNPEIGERNVTGDDNPGINEQKFRDWIMNVKTIFVLKEEIKNWQTIPDTRLDKDEFTNQLELNSKEIEKNIREIVERSSESSKNEFKKKIKKLLKKKSIDPMMKWFFSSSLSEQGEEVELWFFEKLLELKKDKVLEDVVILRSANVITNLPGSEKNTQKEFDFILISWSRQLIIGVETKRSLRNDQAPDKAMEQLQKSRTLFEEKLGDQIGRGWTFFPVLCIQKEHFDCETPHLITMDTDIKAWMDVILQSTQIPEVISEDPSAPLEQLKKILQIIVFTVHVSKKNMPNPITATGWADYVIRTLDNLSTCDNVIFYSKFLFFNYSGNQVMTYFIHK